MGTVAAKKERGTSPFLALMRTSVSLWIVVVMMAMSFGAGVIVKAIAEPADAPIATTTLPTNPGQIVAPPLTDEQIAGGMPSGHPDLSEDGSGGGGNGGGGNGQTQGGGGNGGQG
jgi:uncharacterized membrane protein YgcG